MAGSNDNFISNSIVGNDSFLFIANASEIDVLFNAKYSLVRLLTFGLFQNRLLDPAGSRIKEESKLNEHVHKVVFVVTEN